MYRFSFSARTSMPVVHIVILLYRDLYLLPSSGIQHALKRPFRKRECYMSHDLTL